MEFILRLAAYTPFLYSNYLKNSSLSTQYLIHFTVINNIIGFTPALIINKQINVS